MTDNKLPDDLMHYDQLAQLALRGVVREALRRAEREGLPGDHHFFIAFNTRYPGVDLSPRTLERYPREMTIVLQHQFWNLRVHESFFEVELSFDNIPEKLVIPFNAIKGFLDPAVQFGLQFEEVPVEEQAQPEPKQDTASASKPEAVTENPEATKVVSLDAFRKK